MARRPPTVIFWTAASSKIGVGHLFRCLAIAEEMKQRGWSVKFAVPFGDDKGIYRPLKGIADGIRSLPGNGFSGRALTTMSGIVKKECPQAVVIDSYVVKERALDEVRELGPRIVMIDDNGRIKRGFNILINSNPHARKDIYKPDKGSKTLLGLSYCPFRMHLRKLRSGLARPRAQPRNVVRLLVTIGGGKHPTVLSKILRPLLTEKWLHSIDITQHKNQTWKANDPRFHFIGFQKDFPSYIRQYSLAITAGGSSCYQFACLGIPTISVTLAPNQVAATRKMDRMGFTKWVGDYQDLTKDRLTRILRELSDDQQARKRMASIGFKSFDGHGAGRIVDVIEEAVR